MFVQSGTDSLKYTWDLPFACVRCWSCHSDPETSVRGWYPQTTEYLEPRRLTPAFWFYVLWAYTPELPPEIHVGYVMRACATTRVNRRAIEPMPGDTGGRINHSLMQQTVWWFHTLAVRRTCGPRT